MIDVPKLWIAAISWVFASSRRLAIRTCSGRLKEAQSRTRIPSCSKACRKSAPLPTCIKKKWVAENYPQYKTDPDFVYPEGESFRQMQERSVNFIASLASSHSQETILFVVHAGVIRGLVCHFLGLNYAENLKRKISHRYIGDFVFEGAECSRYNEFGKPSGFVRDGVIAVPRECQLKPVPKRATR